ncbi:T6SS immunity protein Tdi1 domain-containing protein [Clostridium neuense]|uniref:T6SS immunity protein Tdi1 domain-containing protein n=1 Tax=Clostridium neuense TaxID=1728934 RepID=A0ABW8TLJ9_9CLOT
MQFKVFNDFVLKEKVLKDVLDEYEGKLPEQLITAWKDYGFGTILSGYIKIINPKMFEDILKETYFRSIESIPIMVTGFGDIITWEKNKYVGVVKYRKGKANIVSASFKYFFQNLLEECFLDEDLEWKPYLEAINDYGKLDYEECFGYVPLLGLGGSEKVENLKKVKIREHIEIITQLVGKIE